MRVANDLAGSSKTWAQAYLYALDCLNGAAVALGSDTNGLAGAPGPRFGPRAGAALTTDRKRRGLRQRQLAVQENAVRYSGVDQSQLPCRSHPPLIACVTGERRFDVNLDGMAHYGMIPDLLQDLRNVGVPQASLLPLFTSAEAYVSLWERVAG